MDVVGTLLSVTQTLLASVQCSELKELCSILGYRSELADLERTVNTIKAVLLDAESKQMEVELTHQAKLWIDELKDALYDADDLVDEFLTLARQKKLMMGGNCTQKVCGIFSRYNSLAIARKISKGVREITKKLDAIAKNHNQFGFRLDCQPTRQRRVETGSLVSTQGTIGRQDDLEKIVGRLLDPNVQKDETSCLTIVGIGGLGKTALAQLVYNDPRIQEEFPLRLWTCISDEKTWDLVVILHKILASAKGMKNDNLSVDHLQKELREELVQKKYLIVLDDIWTEGRDEWITLMGYLRGGLRGSWVIATTRSKITATIIGGEIHDLKGLSDEDSWQLFEKVAFGPDQYEQVNRIELDEIGRAIVKKHCANVPLAIRVAGSALYRQDKKNWLWFLEVGLRRVMKGADDIKPILKLSYFHLDPPLRTCFSYCSIFPKDYVIDKVMLIDLWIAQGYVVPCDEAQSIEDTSEEYFLTLLKRCFFQDVKTDKYGEIISFKMHDLMHDIAQEVAKDEIVRPNSSPSNSNNKIRHVYHLGWDEGTKSLFTGHKIRTYLGTGWCTHLSPIEFGTVLAKWRSLRVLDLSNSEMKNLPIQLGKLLHLRYLDLSWNQLDMIPSAITKLHNLQVLRLCWCSMLRKLPEELGKLTNLRVLHVSNCESLEEFPKDIGSMAYLRVLDLTFCENLKELPRDLGNMTNLRVLNLSYCKTLKELPRDLGNMTNLQVLDTIGCKSLTHMPRGIGKLVNLWKLPHFVLGEGTPSNERRKLADHLEEIKSLQNLKGSLHLKINIPTTAEDVVGDGGEGGCVSPYLTEISIEFPDPYFECGQRVYEIDETLLEGLQPHPNLTKLELNWYTGRILPNWARGENLAVSLPNLVRINLSFCGKLPHLPMLGKLPKLKFLVLCYSNELEYMENTTMSRRNGGDVEELFFPSLERLALSYLWKLKGWWRDDGNSSQEDGEILLPSFPRLSHLKIQCCPSLTSMPLCTSVENLEICRVDDLNLPMKGVSKLRSVTTDNIELLKSGMPTEGFSCLERIAIHLDSKVEKLVEVEEVFHGCLASLRELQIKRCYNLKSLCGGLERLTALEILELRELPNLSLTKTGEGKGDTDGEEDVRLWQTVGHSLTSLELRYLPKVVKLPHGMRHLTALQSLTIDGCKNLEAMPEWMPELISLKHLQITNCSDALNERCRDGIGQDWPYIQHIHIRRV